MNETSNERMRIRDGAGKFFKEILTLFFTFFKIGLVCFGGGYTMIALIERDVVEKRKWLTTSEMMDILAVAESTPGPISMNTATYVGTKRAGFLGALACTFGAALPSFLIIFALSFFIEEFQNLTYVGYAFRGIRVAVLVLILNAVLKMFRNVEKGVFSILVILFVLLISLLTDFYVIYTLLICAAAGILYNFVLRAVRYTRGYKKR
ncbi:MAG: chromate transporter [Clostridia bacterium]|nr:chromate transporter [Clostridia bacterium]